jgi:hypothetical protein
MTVVAERLRFVAAPDGRDVAFAVWGDPAGFPVKVDDAGHMSRDPVEQIAEDVRWLRDGTPPA